MTEILDADIQIYQWPIVPRGGQHTNGSGMCGVLLVHIPTGIGIVSETERSQHKNRVEGLRRLREVLGLLDSTST